MDFLILLSTSAITLLLGILVLSQAVRKPYAQAFAAMCIAITVWITANYITNHYVIDLNLTNIANKVAYASGYGIVLAGLTFTYHFPLRRKTGLSESAAIWIGALVIIFLSFTDAVSGHVVLGPNGTLTYTTAPLLWAYVLGFLATVALLSRNLLTVPRSEGKIKRSQARFILYAFSSSALLGLFLNAILPLLGSTWDTTRFGPLVTVILVVILAYTIVRHGLFDIRLAVVRGAAYVLSLLTLGGLYYLVAFTISELFFNNQSTSTPAINQNPISILLALALAFIFQPVKAFFDKLTNRIFYKSNYSIDEFIIRVSRRLTMSNDLRELLQRAAQDIADTLKIEQVLFTVRFRNSHSHTMSAGTNGHGRLSSDDLVVVDEFFQHAKDTILVVDTMSDTEETVLRRLFSRHNIAAAVPLWQAGTLLGYVFLGHKRTGHYVRRDINALRTIRDELVIAIQNALSVQEVKDINETLEQRVDEATKELRASNNQLQRLDEAKDEFLSMASHQLRTPLTSVKGYLSMVLEGDVGKITTTQRQLLGEAFTSSERMVHLINDFLNVSRLQTGKFMLETRPVNLAKVVGQEVDSLQTTAGAHSMKLEYHMPSHFPILYVDESKIRQVVMNFIDNAIYYSKEDSTITTSLGIEEGSVLLKVHDTGIGVPAEEQAHIFTKFFRATNARKQRPDGTGVGLFLAKKVIVAHGGSMVFESKEGEGSTFGFRLPVKKLSEVPGDNPDKLNN